MSLMQLLTNGKTLMNLKHSTSRYHMPGKTFLPKFGPVKNPFTAQPPGRPDAGAREATSKAKEPAPKILPLNLKETQRLAMTPAKMKETKRLPFVAARKSAEPQTHNLAWWEKFLDRAGEIMTGLAGWVLREKSSAKSAIPRFAKPVVQGELSLENIRVVRNDLNDGDLEVVPAKTFSGGTNFKPALQPQTGGRLTMAQGSVA